MKAAIREWASAVRYETWVEDLSEQFANRVIEEMDESDFAPTPLTGLSGVWSMSGLLDETQFFINIVKSA